MPRPVGCSPGATDQPLLHHEFPGIDSDDFVLVLNVDVNHPFFVAHAGFGPASQFDGAHHSPGIGGQDGGVLAFGVEGENPIAGRVVEKGVRTGADLDAGRFLQRRQIEDGDRRVAAIAGETTFQLGASTTPWTPMVLGMSPTTLPLSTSITMTWLPRVMYSRLASASMVR